jgi:hypothetical protein
MQLEFGEPSSTVSHRANADSGTAPYHVLIRKAA